MAVRIQLRRDTAANWSSTNPVLNNGEPGFDTTNKILKIGDGVTAWNSLPNKFATDAQGALADSALQPGDIGVTVQGYSADTVIDANYVATENSYTTTEKNKLAGIADGATANDTDANLLNRANHTGTQTAATISDFDTEVSNNTDVAANTSARHDAVTVVDSSEIDFTLTGQQITASIVAGSIDESKLDASVNASLDLADSSVQTTGDQSIAGTKTFTTALILPNNSRINGVEHFYQTTKPTTRGDSSALVAGDRWWKTDDGTEWFWNGTYWLSVNETALGHIGTTTTLSSVDPIVENTLIKKGAFDYYPIQGGEALYLKQVILKIYGNNTYTIDENNKFDLYAALCPFYSEGEVFILTLDSLSKINAVNGGTSSVTTLDVGSTISQSPFYNIQVALLCKNVVGTPSLGTNARWSWSFILQSIYP